MKKSLYLLTLLGFFHSFAQDYTAIDLYLKSNINIKDYTTKGEFESLNLLLSTNDCDNCIPAFFSYINNITDKKPYTVNIITDNIAYAKKTLGNAVHFKYNLYYNKDVFSKYLNGRSGIYYKDMSYTVYGKEKDIRIKLKNSEERIAFFNNFTDDKARILIQDSLMSNTAYIIPSPLPDNQLLVLDNKMDTALLLELEREQDSFAVIQSKYYTPSVSNPQKLFDLPSPIDNLLSFEENKKHLKNIHTNMIKLYSVTYWNGIYYCVFGLTRMFKNNDKDTINFLQAYFVATQKADGKGINQILDASAYDNYYMIDDLPYEGITYRIIGETRTKPLIVADNKLNWRARIPHPETRSTTYAGLATLELKNSVANIIGIDRKFDEFLSLNSLFEFDGKFYYLYRNITSEENNEGYFSTKEFDSQFINRFYEKTKNHIKDL